MSHIKAWLLEGWTRFKHAVHGLVDWLVGPIGNARRFAVGALEWFRAFFSGSAVFCLIAAVEWATSHLSMLSWLDPATSLKIAGFLGFLSFVLHILVQFFQQSPTPPPTATDSSNQAPLFVPVPTPATPPNTTQPPSTGGT